MGESKKYDVVVLGGGLAGPTCGWYLQEAGLNVLILERASRAGGLTGSWQVHEQGDPEAKKFVRQYLQEEDLVLQYPMHMIFRAAKGFSSVSDLFNMNPVFRRGG
jgi:flavin-dependent dehydrogenase